MENPIEATFPYFTLNGSIGNRDDFTFSLQPNILPVYEVIRVVNSKPLFLDDHLQRLSESCLKLNINCDVHCINKWLATFLRFQKVVQCNLRLSITKNEKASDFLAYFISSKYPTPKQYTNGVSVELLSLVRDNPSVKVENRSLRELANEIISQRNVYEVLLVNQNGEITEGSRSNFFAVKGNTIYTAPLYYVLEGITRKKVVQLTHENGIECVEKPIRVEDLTTFDGAFITGTSPKVLPVSRIGKVAFKEISQTTKTLIEKYDQLIRNYLDSSS
jgi:branched-chain amino acid aminotransferase